MTGPERTRQWIVGLGLAVRLAGSALGETIYALSGTNLLRVDSATPGTT